MIKKIRLTFAILVFSLGINAQTPCSGGSAGPYDCGGLDLQSYISAATMGGIEGQDSWGWTDTNGNGDEYAIVAMDNGTAFVRITDPVNPVYLGRLPTRTGSSYWRDVKTFNNHAYIVSDDNGNHGVQVFDLTNLRGLNGTPTITFSAVTTYGRFTVRSAHNIIINEDTGYGYVLGSNLNSGGPHIINLANPAVPVAAGNISSYGYCHDAQVVVYNGPDTEHIGKEILIGSFSGSDFVRVLDVTNKGSISQLSVIDYPNKEYTHQGWFTDDQRFFILGDELDETGSGFNTRTLVFDMIDLDNPQLILQYEGPSPATDHNGYVRGNRFYLANYTDGVRVLKIDGLYDATPSLSEEDYFDTFPTSDAAGTVGGIWNVYPFFESGNLIATGFNLSSSSTNNGLYILKDPLYDNTPPTVVCQPYTAVLNKATGTVTIDAFDIDGGSTDNIGITKRTLAGQTTFTCADVGEHTVTLTIEDDYGFKSSCTTTVTVVGEETTYQGGGVWSNGLPDTGSNARISSADFDTAQLGNSSFSACTCEIDNGRTLTVGADTYIEIENDIIVNGSLIVKHTGNVVQTMEDAEVIKGGAGVINVELTTPVLQTRDFMVMGSPMDAETRNDVFSNAFLVLNHHPTDFVPDNTVPNPHGVTFADLNGNFWKSYSGAINVGEGYIVRPQDSYTDPANEAYNMTYSQGTLNNGIYTRAVTRNGANDDTPNVYANPYASAMSGFELINQNPLINEIYFWEHLTPPSPSIPGWNSTNFSMRDISMYNLGGGTKAPNDTSPGGDTEPNGVISTGQGFAIMATGSGTITMNNSMRLTSGNTTLRSPNEEDLDKIWLKVTSVDYDVSSSTLLGFNPMATPNIDPGYDSKRLSDQLSIHTTHTATGLQLGIQTTSAFDPDMKIPVGFLTKIETKTAYEIAIDKMIGDRISNAKVFLHDSQENVIVDLTIENYVFETNAIDAPERFTLFFKTETTLGPEEQFLQNIKLYPNPAKDVLTILSLEQPLERIEIYDMRGRLLEQDLEEEITSTSIDIARLKTGVYFVKVYIESGTITKKLIKE